MFEEPLKNTLPADFIGPPASVSETLVGPIKQFAELATILREREIRDKREGIFSIERLHVLCEMMTIISTCEELSAEQCRDLTKGACETVAGIHAETCTQLQKTIKQFTKSGLSPDNNPYVCYIAFKLCQHLYNHFVPEDSGSQIPNIIKSTLRLLDIGKTNNLDDLSGNNSLLDGKNAATRALGWGMLTYYERAFSSNMRNDHLSRSCRAQRSHLGAVQEWIVEIEGEGASKQDSKGESQKPFFGFKSRESLLRNLKEDYVSGTLELAGMLVAINVPAALVAFKELVEMRSGYSPSRLIDFIKGLSEAAESVFLDSGKREADRFLNLAFTLCSEYPDDLWEISINLKIQECHWYQRIEDKDNAASALQSLSRELYSRDPNDCISIAPKIAALKYHQIRLELRLEEDEQSPQAEHFDRATILINEMSSIASAWPSSGAISNLALTHAYIAQKYLLRDEYSYEEVSSGEAYRHMSQAYEILEQLRDFKETSDYLQKAKSTILISWFLVDEFAQQTRDFLEESLAELMNIEEKCSTEENSATIQLETRALTVEILIQLSMTEMICEDNDSQRSNEYMARALELLKRYPEADPHGRLGSEAARVKQKLEDDWPSDFD